MILDLVGDDDENTKQLYYSVTFLIRVRLDPTTVILKISRKIIMDFEIELLQDDMDTIESLVTTVMEDVKKYAAFGQWNLTYQGIEASQPNKMTDVQENCRIVDKQIIPIQTRTSISKTSIILLIFGIIIYYMAIFLAHPEIVY